MTKLTNYNFLVSVFVFTKAFIVLPVVPRPEKALGRKRAICHPNTTKCNFFEINVDTSKYLGVLPMIVPVHYYLEQRSTAEATLRSRLFGPTAALASKVVLFIFESSTFHSPID